MRFHAAQLASSFDKEGEIPWSTARSRAFFIKQTPHKAYVKRVRSIETVDYTALLQKIGVPTLILIAIHWYQESRREGPTPTPEPVASGKAIEES